MPPAGLVVCIQAGRTAARRGHIRFCGFAGALAVDTRANSSTDFLVWNNADTGVKRAEWLLPSTRTIPQDDENDQSVYAPRMVAESF